MTEYFRLTIEYSIVNSPINRDLRFDRTPRAGSTLRYDRLSLSGLGRVKSDLLFSHDTHYTLNSSSESNLSSGFDIWDLRFKKFGAGRYWAVMVNSAAS